jgi:hypothetical protein
VSAAAAKPLTEVQAAALFLVGVLREGFGDEATTCLMQGLARGDEDAFRAMHAAATRLLALTEQGALPPGFEALPGVYWAEAERLKVARAGGKAH